MRPMMLAQTIVELPKYGARRREAAISVESVPAPAVNTSSPRRRRLTVAATGTAADGAASASVRQPAADGGAVVPALSPCASPQRLRLLISGSLRGGTQRAPVERGRGGGRAPRGDAPRRRARRRVCIR